MALVVHRLPGCRPPRMVITGSPASGRAKRVCRAAAWIRAWSAGAAAGPLAEAAAGRRGRVEGSGMRGLLPVRFAGAAQTEAAAAEGGLPLSFVDPCAGAVKQATAR